MLSDIEIAQNAKMLKIKDIAKELGIDEEELIPYLHCVSLHWVPSLALRAVRQAEDMRR